MNSLRVVAPVIGADNDLVGEPASGSDEDGLFVFVIVALAVAVVGAAAAVVHKHRKIARLHIEVQRQQEAAIRNQQILSALEDEFAQAQRVGNEMSLLPVAVAVPIPLEGP